MKTLLLCIFLTGCATGDWADYNYGPGDWLNENTSLSIHTMYNYEHFIEPTIEIHYVASMEASCGTKWVQGCAYQVGNRCDIYVGEAASSSTIAHEERHCRGWTHYSPDYEMFSMMGPEQRAREVARASVWFPEEQVATEVMVAQVRGNH